MVAGEQHGGAAVEDVRERGANDAPPADALDRLAQARRQAVQDVLNDDALERLQQCNQRQPMNQSINQSHTHSLLYFAIRLESRKSANKRIHLSIYDIYTRLTAPFPGLPGWAGTRKVKPIWILPKQESVSGSGIS